MSDQIKSWGQLLKEWMVNFFGALSKKPNIMLLYLLVIGGWVSGIKTCNKVDVASGKAAGAAQVADEAKKTAENKDLEQASYEALAKTIEDLQTENDAVKERLALLLGHVQNIAAQPPAVVRVFTPTGPVSAAPPIKPPLVPSSIIDEPAPPPPPAWETLKSQMKK